jgi:hypothetical protein
VFATTSHVHMNVIKKIYRNGFADEIEYEKNAIEANFFLRTENMDMVFETSVCGRVGDVEISKYK